MFWLECQYSGSALLGFNRQTSSYFLHTGIIKSGKKMVISSGIVWMRILVLFWYCFWNQNWVRNFVGLCINIVRFWYVKLFHSSGKKKEFNFFMVEVPIILKPVHWIFFPYSVRIRGKMGKKKLYLNTSYDVFWSYHHCTKLLPADLVKFTEEMFTGKLHFLWSASSTNANFSLDFLARDKKSLILLQNLLSIAVKLWLRLAE